MDVTIENEIDLHINLAKTLQIKMFLFNTKQLLIVMFYISYLLSMNVNVLDSRIACSSIYI